MLRQLLTLLAVFTGLTTAVAPTHAFEAGTQTVQLAESAATCQAQAAAIAELGLDRHLLTDEHDKICLRPVLIISTPTVMLRVDRSRE